ncbi:MAG: ZIP family metal transporter, partial [Bacillota bacterium]
MTGVVAAVMLGTVSGIAGTGLGGVLAAIRRKPDRRTFATMVGFSGGMMLSVTIFDLIPESLTAAPLPGVLGLLAGIGFMVLTDLLIPRPDSPRPGRSPQYVHAGLVVGLGIAAHNFAEGLAVGSGYAVTARLGIQIAVIIGLHDVPEGMALATMLRLGSVRRLAVVLAAAASGVPMAAGALAGAIMGSISRAGMAISLGAA